MPTLPPGNVPPTNVKKPTFGGVGCRPSILLVVGQLGGLRLERPVESLFRFQRPKSSVSGGGLNQAQIKAGYEAGKNMKIEKEDIQSFFDHFLSQQKFFVVEGLVAKSNAGVITRFPIKSLKCIQSCWYVFQG